VFKNAVSGAADVVTVVVLATVVVTPAVVVVVVVTSSVTAEDTTGLSAEVSALHPDNTITADIMAESNFLYLIVRPPEISLYYIKRIKRQNVTLFSENFSFLYGCTKLFVNSANQLYVPNNIISPF